MYPGAVETPEVDLYTSGGTGITRTLHGRFAVGMYPAALPLVEPACGRWELYTSTLCPKETDLRPMGVYSVRGNFAAI